MSRVGVAVEALNRLLSALEGLPKYVGLARAVQSSVRSLKEDKIAQLQKTKDALASTTMDIASKTIAEVGKKEVDNAAERAKSTLDKFTRRELPSSILKR